MRGLPGDELLYLSRKDVERAIEDLDPVAVVRTALEMHGRGDTILPAEALLRWQNSEGEWARSLNMPAFLGGDKPAVGTKVINGNVDNVTRGVPRASGLTLLFDVTTGRVLCVMDGGYISALRTASVTLLAAQALASRVTEVALLGAGVLGEAHLGLIASHLPELKQIRLFDTSFERARELSDRYRSAAPVTVATGAEDAIRDAHLVVTATTTTQPYVPFEWLAPGAVVVPVSLDDLHPDVFLRAGLLIVDDWELVKAGEHRLLGRLYRDGVVTDPGTAPIPGRSRPVDAELGEILAGITQPRRGADDVVVVNPFGMAIEDVAVAAAVHRRAVELGLGQWLER